MKVLVTGANGFVGKALVRRLLATRSIADHRVEHISLLDLTFDQQQLPEVSFFKGSVNDPELLRRALADRPNYIFHLACVPGGAAESNYDLSLEVNLLGTLSLLECLRASRLSPVLVFTSSIGVYGELPDFVDDNTPAAPNWTYGAHKLVGEVLMQDYARRGWVDSRTIRLPGIVVRPPEDVGALSAFMSDVIREIAAGRPYTCPVSSGATAWWMSVKCCVDNLLHAAAIPSEALAHRRCWMLPTLRLSISDLVDGLAEIYGPDLYRLITYLPQPAVEQRFGRLPPLRLSHSEAIGFKHDGSVAALLRGAFSERSQVEVVGH